MEQATHTSKGSKTDSSEPFPEAERQFRDIIDLAAQETDDNQQKIAGAKDKAQLSTTGSLSLSLIIVLKQLLDELSTGRRDTMIYFSLALVLTCLVFQTAISFLIITIYSKNKTAPVPDQKSASYVKRYSATKYSETLFHTNHEILQKRNEVSNTTLDGPETTAQPLNEVSPLTAHIFRLFRDLDSSATQQPWYVTCFPCLKLKEDEIDEKYNFEEAIRRLHEILTTEKLKASFEFTEAQFYASNYLSNEEQLNDGKQQNRNELLEAKRKKLNTLTTLHKLLDLQLDLQWRRKAFTDLFRLQKTLTYFTYVVFVLNSFITGFGLTSTSVSVSVQ